MYLYQSEFSLPKNPKAKMWRFMDLYKFLSLIQTSKLYFSRSDKFKDPFEGKFPGYNFRRRKKHYYNYKESEKMFTDRDVLFEKTRAHTVINCWHINPYESAAMWDLYTTNSGIALETTFEDFTNCFTDTKEEVLIGKVRYIDFDKEWMPESHFGHLYLHKRKSFKHENEIRAFVTHDLNEINKGLVEEFESGVNIKVNLDALIKRIHLHPSTYPSFIKTLEDIVRKYNIKAPIIKSDLYDLK